MKWLWKRIRCWFKKKVSKYEITMGIDVGYRDSSIVIVRWNRNTNTMEVLSDYYSKKGDLLELDRQIRELVKRYQPTRIVADIPVGLRDQLSSWAKEA